MANDNLDDMLDKALGLKPDNAKLSSNTANNVSPANPVNNLESLEDKLKKLLELIAKEKQSQVQPQVQDTKSESANSNIVVNVAQNVMPETKSNVVCESCGSTAIQILNDTFGMCKHCGARVIIKKPVNTPPVKINIVNDKAEIDSPYYVMKTNYDEAEFKRKALINLAAIKDTPTNILESKFKEIYINYPQFMVCAIHVDGSYSASIGYDRVEQYEDYEQKWDSDLKMWVKRRVIKERTVTDWQPYNGNVSTDATLSIGIKGTFANNEESYFDDLIAGCDLDADAIKFEDSGLEMQFATPSPVATATIIHKAKERAKNQIHFPGKHIKDIRTNFSHRIISTKYCIVPEYVMPYEKNGTEYEACSFATRFGLMGNFPSVENGVTAVTNKQSRKYGMISILLSLLSMGLAIAFPFILMNVYGVWLGIISMTPSIVGYVVYKKLWAKKEKTIYQSLLDEKLDQVENYLAKNNMAPLTVEEKGLFKVK